MGIYIPNVPLPNCCIDCPIYYDNYYCPLVGKIAYNSYQAIIDDHKEKFPDCPLIESKDPQ